MENENEFSNTSAEILDEATLAHSKSIPSKCNSRFPKHENLLNQWLQIIGYNKEKINDYSRICSEHFCKDDFTGTRNGRLKSTAVPKYNLIKPENKSCERVEADRNLPENVNFQGLVLVPLQLKLINTSIIKEHQTNESEVINVTNEPIINTLSSINPNNLHNNEIHQSDLHNNEANHPTTHFVTSVKKKPNRPLGQLRRRDFTSDWAWKTYRKTYFDLKTRVKVLKRNLVKRNVTKEKRSKLVSDSKANELYEPVEFLEVCIQE